VRIRASAPPAGVVTPNATWLSVQRADGVTQPVAVFRPKGGGPHPVVVYLHGASGLASAQLGWVPQLAAAGFIVVIGCYLDVTPSVRSAKPGTWVRCPTLPDGDHASAGSTRRGYEALLDTAASLPDARPDHLGVVGVSYGGILALTTAEPRVTAIVADSAYGAAGTKPVTAAVLLLGMTNDPNVAHAKVVAFDRSLRQAGKPVESHYYDGTGHVATLDVAAPAVGSDASARAVAFLQAHLG
jgi:dienelactone hydrolase